jgi:hypothetical protein
MKVQGTAEESGSDFVCTGETARGYVRNCRKCGKV